MFVTLRCGNRKGDEIQCIESTTMPPYEGPASSHSACNPCRSKKLKCDGGKTGCERCFFSSIECSYMTERTIMKKRKHHVLTNSSQSTATQISQREHQSRLRSSPGEEGPTKRMNSSKEALSANDTIELCGLENQDMASEVQVESYLNAKGRPDSADNVESTNEDLVPTISRSVQRPSTAVVPTSEVEQSSFDKEFFDQYFTALEQSDDILGHNQQQHQQQKHSAISLYEDAGEASGMSNLTDEQSVSDEGLTFSTHESLVVTDPSTPVSPGVSFLSTMPRRSGTTSYHKRCASIDSSIEHDPSPHSCQCTRSALQILQVLSSLFKPAEDLYAVEKTLYTLKQKIGKCRFLVECAASGRDSGFELLVIILCEKMTSIFEEISAAWERQLQAVARMRLRKTEGAVAVTRDVYPAPQNDNGDSQYGRVTIGGYQMDTIEERHTVFGILIQLQLKRLINIMEKLRQNAVTENLVSHLAILIPMNQKIKSLKATLGRITQ